MIKNQLDLISEQTSPLFRIMWVTNPDEASRRNFDNNISAFHIGGGYILSVAHNLRIENPLVKSFDEQVYQSDIYSRLNPAQKIVFDQCYIPDANTGKRHIQLNNPTYIQSISETLKAINFDSRWITLGEKKISTPMLIIQFSNNLFYNDASVSDYFRGNYFFEPTLNRHTFLLETELVKAFYESDIAVYKIKKPDAAIIHKIPSVKVDFSIINDSNENLFCLQSSPAGFLGRLLNKAWMEGFLDHHQVFNDRVGGNYILEGIRYLIKGYFRFGSSGAPYLIYDETSDAFKVNAIQSEASPVQLSINNNREGNYQYVNAIASPLHLVKSPLEAILKGAT